MAAIVALLFCLQQHVPPSDPLELGWGIEPRVAAWFPNPSGSFSATQARNFGPIVDGSDLDFDDDLDLEDDDLVGYFELGFSQVFKVGSERATVDRFWISTWAHSWHGESTPGGTVTFDGDTFAAGLPLRSKLSIVDVGFDGVPIYATEFDGRFVGSMTAGIRYIHVEMRLSNAVESAEDHIDLVYAGIGFRLEWRMVGPLFVAANTSVYFSLGAWSDDESAGTHWTETAWAGIATEGCASVGVDIWHVRIETGFRWATNAFDVEQESQDSFADDEVNYFVGGPFLQASVRW